MPKPFDIRPRWRNFLLLRALLFVISVALSSSGEDVEPTFDTTDRILSAPRRRLGQVSSVGSTIDSRELHSNSAASKSSKGGSKSGSKGSKSKSSKSGSKSKSAKSGSKGSKGSNSKSEKSGNKESKSKSRSGSKGSKSKSAKSGSKSDSKGSKSKSAESGSKSDSEGSKSKTGKSESAKGKSAKSVSSAKSTSIETSSSDIDTENLTLTSEDETTVDTQSTSAEMKYYDSMDVEGDNQSVSGSVSSQNLSTEDAEATEITRSAATPPSLDGDENKGTATENEGMMETENLEDDFMDERIKESYSDINCDGDHDADCGSNDSLSQAEMGESGSARSEVDKSSDEGMINTAFIEERIEENESIEDFEERDAIFDPSMESLE